MIGTFWNALEHRAVLFVSTLAAVLLVAGCAGTPKYTRVNVPVPVECMEVVPDRPAMPTEALAPGAAPWVLLRAALAEIDRREAYEVRMRTALDACTSPTLAGP